MQYLPTKTINWIQRVTLLKSFAIFWLYERHNTAAPDFLLRSWMLQTSLDCDIQHTYSSEFSLGRSEAPVLGSTCNICPLKLSTEFKGLLSSKVLQYFDCTKDTIRQLRIFCWGRECYKPHWTVTCQARLILSECYSPDLPASASESTILALPDFSWSIKFLQPGQNFLNLLVTILWSTAPSPFVRQIFCMFSRCYGPVETRKAQVPKLDYIAHSSMQFSDHTQSEGKWSKVKLCATCQRTNYLDTTNQNGYQPRLELLRSGDIRVCIANIFNHPRRFFFFFFCSFKIFWYFKYIFNYMATGTEI